ncbi:MAG: hypothetical protein DCF31_17745 [Alphaproteobacteria bacterium]|nr:MAG: hypothetical protein DCF31_17745 [Alphaproteobacteria bacterium]
MDIISTLGAGSGIDTKTLIDGLVAAEKSARQTPLTTKAAALDARISALGQVRSALQGIATSLETRVGNGALGLAPQSSNTGAVAIAAFGTGPTGAFVSALTVNRLAAAQQLTGPALTGADQPVGEGTLTIGFGTRTANADGSFSFAGNGGAGVDIVIDATNNTLAGLRDAINRSGAGVTAAIVAGNGQATLTLRGTEGAANGFILSAAGDPGLARFSYTPGAPAMTLVAGAVDADISIDGIAVTRGSNVIDDLVTGTRIRLLKADAAPVTISAARDGAQIGTTVADLASALSAMRSLIGDFRKGAAGSEAPGALANDATARVLDQRLAALVATPFAEANGLRLLDLGVTVSRTGEIGYDAARFARLSPTRLGDAEALLKVLAAPASATRPSRLQSIAALATPASLGLSKQKSAVTASLAREEARLATYRATLTRQYGAMERLVAASKAVGAQLDQQIKAWQNQDN